MRAAFLSMFAAFVLIALSNVPYAGAEDAGEAPAPLAAGDAAPDFKLPEPSGGGKEAPRKLSDFQGKKHVVVAFYPKVFTPGCTAQLCGYRDEFRAFRDAETTVVAVSIDEQEASDRFRGEYELPFIVVGDAEGKIVKYYGVEVRGAFAARSVFLVDKEGVIRYIDREYDVRAGKEGLYKAMAALKAGGEQ